MKGEIVSKFVAGQRWINDAELSLGLGTVLCVEHRTVSLIFHASGETRTYAQDSAPLTRIRFNAGDNITDIHQRSLTIEQVSEQNGLLTYHVSTADGDKETLEERDLSTTLRLNQPMDRLSSGQVDDMRWFELRSQAWTCQLKNYQSQMTGLTGARTSLIPHQLYIASEVASRYAPRVMLADEVGLGKTIEAGLILHQQIMTGRASRVLVIVPEALIHQWLVELLRRFNLFFSIFDEERCQAIESSTDLSNPFQAEQLVLCSMPLFTDSDSRLQQAVNAEWDLLIIDEAHHLEWHTDAPSAEYQIAQQLARRSQGLLLLTATPEQFGKDSHFARLQLLDPDRFSDYAQFLEQEQHYQVIANLIDRLNEPGAVSDDTIQQLKPFAPPIDLESCRDLPLTDVIRDQLIHHMLDCHGTGRVLFRNTRDAIQGFPERELIAHPLTLSSEYQDFLKQTTELQHHLHPEHFIHDKADWTRHDSRVDWLVALLSQLVNEKLLVITHYAQTARELQQALKRYHGIACSVFHEDMSIVERDKRAADFADHDTGVPLLICSEIGSEGRNFQFCHHLVLFDLPFNPDLLEQRIGRLDRIGQTQRIRIHVPCFEGSAQQRLFEWYDASLNAFTTPCPAGSQIFSEIQGQLQPALIASDNDDFKKLLEGSRERHAALNQALHDGRDRLLEYSSCRHGIADELVRRIQQFEHQSALESFMNSLFDSYGVNIEEHKPGSYILTPAEHMIGQFPGLDDDGMTITYRRDVALHNDDMHFITWDHPMTLNAIDMLLGNEMGNTSVCSIKSHELQAGQLYIQCLFVIDIDIPQQFQQHIHAHQLQPLPVEICYNEAGEEIPDLLSRAKLGGIERTIAKQIISLKLDIIRQRQQQARQQLEADAAALLAQHHASTLRILDDEVQRLQQLKQINPQVREEEIDFFSHQREALSESIKHSACRLDSIRLLISI